MNRVLRCRCAAVVIGAAEAPIVAVPAAAYRTSDAGVPPFLQRHEREDDGRAWPVLGVVFSICMTPSVLFGAARSAKRAWSKGFSTHAGGGYDVLSVMLQ